MFKLFLYLTLQEYSSPIIRYIYHIANNDNNVGNQNKWKISRSKIGKAPHSQILEPNIVKFKF